MNDVLITGRSSFYTTLGREQSDIIHCVLSTRLYDVQKVREVFSIKINKMLLGVKLGGTRASEESKIGQSFQYRRDVPTLTYPYPKIGSCSKQMVAYYTVRIVIFSISFQ